MEQSPTRARDYFVRHELGTDRLTIEDAQQQPRLPLYGILDNLRSAHNVGSIFRTAEGFGVKKIICSGYTSYPILEDDTRLPHLAHKLTSQIHKTALGAEAMIACEYYETFEAWRLVEPHLPLLALEQAENSISLRDVSPPKRFALLLGEEVEGIASSHLEQSDIVIEIPMKGKKESFNVSIAAGIALYAFTG